MELTIDTADPTSYERFLKIKSLPSYSFRGCVATVPDQYAELLGYQAAPRVAAYTPWPRLWDYQRDVSRIAIEARKFCAFARCGLGKTFIISEFARHCLSLGLRVLIVSPSMVIPQTIKETTGFYGDVIMQRVRAAQLPEWLATPGPAIGITNYEALTDELQQGHLGALILDESSVLKSHYGAWGQTLLRLGRGLDYKLCATGTPAPNDRIEYANHAVFMDAYPTINAFLARFFVNRGQTDNRWELKKHAIRPFYTALSHWSIFLNNPATYGWKDNCKPLPPINVHIHAVPTTRQQDEAAAKITGNLVGTQGGPGGITKRTTLARIGKGHFNGEEIATNKTGYVADLVKSWPDRSSLVWCLYNSEQDAIEAALPNAGGMRGDTDEDERQVMIDAFQAGTLKTIITKPKILGFGLNLQIATRQVFSGLQDSYESYYQAVSRSNRYGASESLDVHLPVTWMERPMIETVLDKAKRIDADTREQEEIFCAHSRFHR